MEKHTSTVSSRLVVSWFRANVQGSVFGELLAKRVACELKLWLAMC
ncbi:hypothetical protein [Tumebacillus lipolyticus]|uniref:Uncharacterized protein n=1 Tax=Tumebacillus lipolyticus TaxID=1280370 RepID=A0ABW4ZXE2_9BACL